MDIDTSEDWGAEPLKLTYDKARGLAEMVVLDVFKLNDDLLIVYGDKSKDDTDKIVAQRLRAVFEAAGFKEMPASDWLPHACAQRIAKSISDRKKKLDQELWGAADVWPVLAGSMATSPEPTLSPTGS